MKSVFKKLFIFCFIRQGGLFGMPWCFHPFTKAFGPLHQSVCTVSPRRCHSLFIIFAGLMLAALWVCHDKTLIEMVATITMARKNIHQDKGVR